MSCFHVTLCVSRFRAFGLRLGVLLVAFLGTALAVATGVHSLGPFGGPLFGLSATDHGKLLVADASVGVIPVRYGTAGAPIVRPGVTDVSPVRGDAMWASTGAGGDPQSDTGQGLYWIKDGVATLVANLWDFEAAYNPDGNDPPDSNPFDVQALGWHAALVADAGGNALLRVDRDGNVKVLAIFQNELVSTANLKALAGCPDSGAPFCAMPDALPAQPVPTSVAIDHHGAIYVGELKGFPAPTDASNIWRISPDADHAICGASPDCVKAFDGGFTSIIDLAMGPDGLLYVAEFDAGSWAAVEIFGTPQGGRIHACNVRHGYCREVASGINELTAIAFDTRGALWATQHSLVPGEAEVVRVRRDTRHAWRHHGHDGKH